MDDDDDNTPGSSSGGTELKEQKQSETDPESGWFHKGEHKEVFAYSVQAACDENGWILGYSIRPGNEHDSQTFKPLYDKLKKFNAKTMVMDAGYKTPAIAKLLIDEGVTPLMPYTRPQTKKGYFRKDEFVYDEYYDCYICPNDKILEYTTTNRDGYREYKSKGYICESCPYLSQCTQSREHIKVVTRHVWQEYIEKCEDIRHTLGMKAVYTMRKETIERDFGTAFRKLSSECKYKHYMCNMSRKSHEHHMTFMAFVYSLNSSFFMLRGAGEARWEKMVKSPLR